jgi:hypothetical protein
MYLERCTAADRWPVSKPNEVRDAEDASGNSVIVIRVTRTAVGEFICDDAAKQSHLPNSSTKHCAPYLLTLLWAIILFPVH